MKKVTRFFSFFLVFALVFGLWMPVDAAENNYGGLSTKDGNGNYDSDWVYWSQGASKYEKMRKYGCYSLAISKLIVEAGLKSANDFTPDSHFTWGRDHGYLAADASVLNPTKMIEAYTGATVYIDSIAFSGSYDKANKKVMELLNDGKYVILHRSPYTDSNGKQHNGHFVYVHREKSIQNEKVMISGSQSDIYNRAGGSVKFKDPIEKKLLSPLSDLGYKNYIDRIITVKVKDKSNLISNPPKESGGTATNTSAESVSFSNYQVRKLTETSAEPYATATATGGKVARVGMYIGTDPNNLQQLGTDNGKACIKKNMWYNTTKYGYTLEPGTTYYYQPFAEVNGTRYYGNTNSFTTLPGKTQAPTSSVPSVQAPAPDTPKPSAEPTEPTYTALVTCNADVLNVRKGPGTSYDKVGSLKRGSKCTVYPNKASGGWSWIEGSSVSGYAATNRLTKFTGNTRTGVVTCNADVLNIRKGPGTSYDKVGQIPNGATCTVYLDVKADWYFVSYGDFAGYASKNKITLK